MGARGQAAIDATGSMPELNVLCAIGDFSAQSGQPLLKHLDVEIVRANSRSQVTSPDL